MDQLSAAAIVTQRHVGTCVVIKLQAPHAIDATAGLLMVPTCLWVTVAAALNWSIYFRLGGAASSDSD